MSEQLRLMGWMSVAMGALILFLLFATDSMTGVWVVLFTAGSVAGVGGLLLAQLRSIEGQRSGRDTVY